MTDGEQLTPNSHGSGRPSSYIGRIHLEVIAILLPVFVILLALGWSIRPQSTGFSAVPENVLVTLSANGINGVSEVLHRTADNGAVLDITADPPWSAGSWTVRIDNLDGARLCTPSELPDNVTPGLALLGPPTPVAPQRLTSLGTSLGVPSYEVKSKGPMSVALCWSSDGPVNLNGPYLSAQFPDVDAHSNSQNRYVEVPMTLVLNADSGNTADYVIQSPSTPTTLSADSWQWSAQTTTASALLRLSAVDTSASQHETFTGFLSGLALGLAGGALIAILLELVGPLSRARDARHPV